MGGAAAAPRFRSAGGSTVARIHFHCAWWRVVDTDAVLRLRRRRKTDM